MQAPNVSLQQLIASFAAQSKQLGLQPAMRSSHAARDSSAAELHEGCSVSAVSDSDQLSTSRSHVRRYYIDVVTSNYENS